MLCTDVRRDYTQKIILEKFYAIYLFVDIFDNIEHFIGRFGDYEAKNNCVARNLHLNLYTKTVNGTNGL